MDPAPCSFVLLSIILSLAAVVVTIEAAGAKGAELGVTPRIQ
jgi:hypothetical protein